MGNGRAGTARDIGLCAIALGTVAQYETVPRKRGYHASKTVVSILHCKETE